MEVASPSGSRRSEASICMQSAGIKDVGPKLDSKKQIHQLKLTIFGEISVGMNILRGHSPLMAGLKSTSKIFLSQSKHQQQRNWW